MAGDIIPASMKRRAITVASMTLVCALLAEPTVGGCSTTLVGPQLHVEPAAIPSEQPTTCVLIFASGALVGNPAGLFYAAMVPVHRSTGEGMHNSLAINITGTPVAGRYFTLDKAMSLLGKFVPHCQLRSMRRALLAGKPQTVGGQRKSTTSPAPSKAPPNPPPSASAPTTPTEQASTHDAVIHFLQGMAALPEGKPLRNS
jgi:hypothetical protein